MSMRDYAVDEYGMVLNEEEIYKIAKALIPAEDMAIAFWNIYFIMSIALIPFAATLILRAYKMSIRIFL